MLASPTLYSFSLSSVAMVLSSWLNHLRRRYLLVILCSPFLVPLVCAMCPFLCTVEICFLLCRRRRRVAVEHSGDGARRFEDGGDEMGLLQRYLEDQLSLVVRSVYEHGDDDENVVQGGRVDMEYFDNERPLRQ